MDARTFSKLVNETRIDQRKKQSSLGSDVGKSQAWISSLEKQDVKLDDIEFGVLKKICKELRFSKSQLEDIGIIVHQTDDPTIELPLNYETYKLFLEAVNDVHDTVKLLDKKGYMGLEPENLVKLYLKSIFSRRGVGISAIRKSLNDIGREENKK